MRNEIINLFFIIYKIMQFFFFILHVMISFPYSFILNGLVSEAGSQKLIYKKNQILLKLSEENI